MSSALGLPGDVNSQAVNKWRSYRKYKDSRIDWLGEIPMGWSIRRLKFVGEINMGQSPPSETYNDQGEGLPFLQGNSDFGAVHPEPRIYCPVPTRTTKRDDLLLSVRAPVGALNVADQMYGIGRGLCAITPDPRLLYPSFARYVISSVISTLQSVATGSTYEAVSACDVGNVIIPVPTLSEQYTIATFLDRKTGLIDALIEKKQRQIELLQEKRAALISHAVTKGLDPNVKMKDSGIEWLGEIPEHWTIAPLYTRYHVQLGKMLDSKRITGKNLAPYLRNADVQWGKINTKDLPVMDFTPADRQRFALRKGDLLVCEGGEIGRTGVWQGEIEECYYQKALHRIRPLHGEDCSQFLYYVMFAAAQIGAFQARADLSTIGHLTGEKLRRHRFAFPPGDEQEKIATYLDIVTAKVDGLRDRILHSIEVLREFRTALISAAVTGKIDVRKEIPDEQGGSE